MILQALCEYYDRKLALGEMPPYGREMKSIPYLVVIDKDGNFLRLESTMEGDGENSMQGNFRCALPMIVTATCHQTAFGIIMVMFSASQRRWTLKIVRTLRGAGNSAMPFRRNCADWQI